MVVSEEEIQCFERQTANALNDITLKGRLELSIMVQSNRVMARHRSARGCTTCGLTLQFSIKI